MPMIKVGGVEPSAIMVGDAAVSAVYRGAELVWNNSIHNLWDYEYFYSSYIEVYGSNVARCVFQGIPNAVYTVSCNFISRASSAAVFAVDGNNTAFNPSTSVNGIMPDISRDVTADNAGKITIGMYVTGSNAISKDDFSNGEKSVSIIRK